MKVNFKHACKGSLLLELFTLSRHSALFHCATNRRGILPSVQGLHLGGEMKHIAGVTLTVLLVTAMLAQETMPTDSGIYYLAGGKLHADEEGLQLWYEVDGNEFRTT